MAVSPLDNGPDAQLTTLFNRKPVDRFRDRTLQELKEAIVLFAQP
jgi:hypothetical protein